MEPWHYVVLLGAVAVVGAMLLPRKPGSQPQQAQLASIEASLEQFMETMDADNQQLLGTVAASQKESQQRLAAQNERIELLEQRCRKLEAELASRGEQLQGYEERLQRLQEIRQGQLAAPVAAALEQGAAPSGNGAPRTLKLRERYAELFSLHEQGKSIDAIAKKTGMNKGEVQLILQLSLQEELHRG